MADTLFELTYHAEVKPVRQNDFYISLTDYRERMLKDAIAQLELCLFKKVTGLTVADFALLVSSGVFNSALRNDAVYKFTDLG